MANDTAVLTIHSTIYGVDSDGLEKCNPQALQMSGPQHQNGASFYFRWDPENVGTQDFLCYQTFQ